MKWNELRKKAERELEERKKKERSKTDGWREQCLFPTQREAL